MQLLTTFASCAAVIAGTEATLISPENRFAGTYNLTDFTLSSQNGTVVRPLGTHPYGRLVLTSDFYFISQFNSGNFASHPFVPFPPLYTPGSNADNAEVVRNSLGLSGSYRVSEQGEYLGLSTTGSTIPNFINSSVEPPNSTFTLENGREILIETLTTAGGGSVVRYEWRRL